MLLAIIADKKILMYGLLILFLSIHQSYSIAYKGKK